MAMDTSERKLHPKLRMLRNGSDGVNLLRAATSQVVASTLSGEALEVALAEAPESFTAARRRPTKPPKLAVAGEPQHAWASVFVELRRGVVGESAEEAAERAEAVAEYLRGLVREADPSIPRAVLVQRNFVAATLPLDRLDELRRNESVAFVHPAEPLTLPDPLPARVPAGAAASPPLSAGLRRQGGSGAIVGIIDVGGFDFAHPDFVDENGSTRFLSIWDQGGSLHPAPAPFDYGSEITHLHLEAALKESQRPDGLPATELERQSQQSVGSHGTHVASIAAGNRGVCPKADIAAVLLDVPAERTLPEQRRKTFSDSKRIVEAVEYLLGVAARERKPISINISLGTNGGAHDGSSGVSRWLDALLAAEGRSICVAAGNAGQEKAERPDDMGWMFGRIHSSGRIEAKGLEVELEWVVVGDALIDVSENELELWYGPQDRFSVAVKPPDSDAWIEVGPRQFIENRPLPNGTFVSVYNEVYHPVNGANYIGIYLSPDFSRGFGVKSGVWKVRLRGEDVRDGSFHCWIERDDPFPIRSPSGQRWFRFPSFFSEGSNRDSHAINSLACGHRVIAVANLDAAGQRISKSSSQGPTRDERSKPDIAAPGTNISAALGFGDSSELWTAKSGTSMASPYVAGVVALMLAENPQLSAAQCQAILQRTSRPLPGASYAWRNDAGFGQIDPEAAVAEARTVNERQPL